MHILHVVGTRPNFMKVAPVMAALRRRAGLRQTLVHTGQHYDRNMSEIFFQQLGIPWPDVSLGVGSGSHAAQTARIMECFEQTVLDCQPDLVLVYGDVNSTMAAALVCAKLHIKIGHVEAGLRSFDRTMPEEMNRLMTDQLSDILFTPSADADENLLREGIPHERIERVGNVMIDTLVRLLPQAQRPDIDGLHEAYALVTLHRPSNVDHPETLDSLLSALADISRKCQIVFPVHPRTRGKLQALATARPPANVVLLDPVGYLEFLALQRDATLVITDSGGIQEETTYLGIPCLTVRENTERPITIDEGTNTLVGTDPARLLEAADQILAGENKPGQIPDLWDGQAGERIAATIAPNAIELPDADRRAG